MLCNKCLGTFGGLLFIVGILFLLRDFGVWNFWNIQWYSALFIIVALTCFSAQNCPNCNPKKKK